MDIIAFGFALEQALTSNITSSSALHSLKYVCIQEWFRKNCWFKGNVSLMILSIKQTLWTRFKS